MPSSLACRAQIDHLAAALRVVMRCVPNFVGYQNSAYLIELKSDGKSLTLSSSNGNDQASVRIPAAGDDFTVLVRGPDINKSIFRGKQPEVSLEVARSKRKGHKLVLHLEEDHEFLIYDEEKYELLTTRKLSRRNRVELTMAGPTMMEMMDYLVKARNEKEDKPIINGLIFSTDKIAITEGHHMHVQGVDNPNPFSAILPKAAADALYVGLQKFTPSAVRIQYTAEAVFVIVFVFENSPGMAVRIVSTATELPNKFHEICPPLDEANIFVLAREPFEQLLKTIIKRKVDTLGMAFAETEVRYHYLDPKGPEPAAGQERQETWGVLPSERRAGVLCKDRNFNPRFLLNAIETLGDPLQIILPWVRVPEGENAGQDDDYWYPVLLNGQVPKRYAIIMPLK